MSKKTEKSPDDLSRDLVANDMNLARAFAVVARSDYGKGRLGEGDSARTNALRFYCEALRLLLQLGECDRKSFASDLEGLRTSIEWLSMQRGASPQLFSSSDYSSIDKLLKLLEKKS